MNVKLAYSHDTLPTKKDRRRKITQPKDLLKVKPIQPITKPQEQMIEAFNEGLNVVAIGSAGTGKSFIASYLALESLFNKQFNKIVVVRSAVPTRDMGHLPGNLQEKSEIYTIPYKQIFNTLCDNGTAWDILIKKNMVEFITTSYVRGITLENSIIIVDEFQSMTNHELYSVLTRTGQDSQLIICGDTKQNDLHSKREHSCFEWFVNIVKRMPNWFNLTTFEQEDIVRSEFVKALITAVENRHGHI